MSAKYSFPKDKIKILLLEGVSPTAVEYFGSEGYQVETRDKALSEKDLVKAIADVHVLGIRSKTEVRAPVLKAAKNLITIGCFCIGTNQVDTEEAARCGVPVFNAPFSNTRSVAELTLAEIVMLSRRAAHKSAEVHQGIWDKSAKDCFEIRGKTVGIIGYGHIGEQVGILAEAFGMRVLFFDIIKKLPLGNARPCKSMKEVLQHADFVTLHVPETPQTKGLIGSKEIAAMKKGSYLLNLSRGTVVEIDALAAALKSKHLAGAGVDVFPEEPNSNDEVFTSKLCGLPNVILTPHIGGSTEEAQRNIGLEVATALVRFTDTGSSSGAVNFPSVDLPVQSKSHRLLNIHRNVPGVLSQINTIVANKGANIEAQYLATRGDIGYLIMDVGRELSGAVKKEIEKLDANIKTRLLF